MDTAKNLDLLKKALSGVRSLTNFADDKDKKSEIEENIVSVISELKSDLKKEPIADKEPVATTITQKEKPKEAEVPVSTQKLADIPNVEPKMGKK